MTKAQAKSTPAKRSTKKTVEAPKKTFERWLLPGIITVALYLFTALVAALSMKIDGGLNYQVGLVTSFLFVATGLTAFWWLIETARCAMLYIESRTAKKTSSKKK